MGFTAGKNSLNTAVAGAAQTQISVTATDRFELNDPVFVDWRTGAIVNQNAMIAAPALNAGPALATFSATEFPATGTTCSNSVVLPDGSLVVLVGMVNTSTNLAALSIHKYSAKGVLLTKTVVEQAVSGNSSYCPSYLSLAMLSNGNIVACYTTAASVIGNWAIFNQNLQLQYNGKIPSEGQASHTLYLQPLINGGFIALHNRGIYSVSAAGVPANVLALNLYSISSAYQDELANNALTQDTHQSSTLINLQPAKLADGGYGFILPTMTGITYCKVKPDGTLGTSNILANWGSQSLGAAKFAVLTGGDIAWAVTTQATMGFWGIVSPEGMVIKASTQLGAATLSNFQLMPDASNRAVIMYYDSSATQLRYFTATGTDVATFPRAAGITWLGGGFGSAFKLSTGTLLIGGSTASGGYIYNYVFVRLDGTLKTGELAGFKQGYNSLSLGGMVVNDTVYGMAIAGNDNSISMPDQIVFSFSSAGVLSTNAQFVGAQLFVKGYVRLQLDITGKFMHAITGIGRDASTATMISTIELSTLSLRQTYQVSYNLQAVRIRSYAQGLLFLDTTAGNTSNFAAASQPLFGVFVKARATTLLGVAAAPAEPGEQLPVNTKGVYAASSSWRLAAQSFDQSANNPPGNAGFLNNGVINLKGL